MNYSTEFKALLNDFPTGYLGYGNPNAKILFLGQEPAIDLETENIRFQAEIASNAKQWASIVSHGIGYEAVNHQRVEFGIPLHPWANQKYQVKSKLKKDDTLRGKEGTSQTWYKYQKLINTVFEQLYPEYKRTKRTDYLNFHQFAFHTDMSDLASKRHLLSDDSKQAVRKRTRLLSHAFFRHFPVVIAAVGHFPKDSYGNSYFEDVFDTVFIGDKGKGTWMNLNVRLNSASPTLLIHCPQITSTSISDFFIANLSEHIICFAKRYNMNLLPSE